MKILDISKQFINTTARIINKNVKNCNIKQKYLPDDIKLKSQPTSDNFEHKIKLEELELEDFLNQGRSAYVYNILDHPDLVARVKFFTDFIPEKLSFKNSDPIRHIIAGTDDFSVTIMNKIKGEPLYRKNWIKIGLSASEYLTELRKIKTVPDESFIKYYNNLLELRKKGYDFDTVNPNNILYDKVSQNFNIVDIEPNGEVQGVTIEDFYPFIDATGVSPLYKSSKENIQQKLYDEIRMFLDKIEEIGKQIGVDLSDKDFNPAHNHIAKRFDFLEY